MQYVLIDEATGIVINPIVLADQSSLPEIPVAPLLPDEPADGTSKEVQAAYEAALQIYQMARDQYLADFAEAVKDRFTSPDGVLLVQSDTATIGDTYANGVFISPTPTPTPEPELPVITAQDVKAQLDSIQTQLQSIAAQVDILLTQK